MSWFQGKYLSYLNPYTAVAALNSNYVTNQVNQQNKKAEVFANATNAQQQLVNENLNKLITTAIIIVFVMLLIMWFIV
jgi:hypothetical protein